MSSIPGTLILREAASELEIGLGRALVLHESARRSTDSRGPEAEIDHLGSFQALIWMQTRASAAPARPNLWKYKHFRAATRIYGLPEGGA